jgi:hypothetical protein
MTLTPRWGEVCSPSYDRAQVVVAVAACDDEDTFVAKGRERSPQLQTSLGVVIRSNQGSAILRRSLPLFAPVNNINRASGNASRPSTMCSRDFTLSAASQPAKSRKASG